MMGGCRGGLSARPPSMGTPFMVSVFQWGDGNHPAYQRP